MVWNFQDSYTKLPSIFYSKVNPENFSNKKLVLFNSDLARQLNLDFSKYDDDEKCNILLGKNKLNKNYFSQAYAGHQFGNFTILGDGRAVIIGEHITNNKQRVDIQLKGSGQTPYSRNGDGKAALGPMMREYILSEAMHNLGISSTRAVVDWMRVGFIHGVMNTDNMSLSGETIDYGPAAYLDEYNPKKVFSSIDKMGRYSFENQSKITLWNLARFAETFLHLIDSNEKTAIKKIEDILNKYKKLFDQSWLTMMSMKLNLDTTNNNNEEIVKEFLDLMHIYKLDYTNTFLDLENNTLDKKIFKNWEEKYKKNKLRKFKNVNPQIIPRNHIIEEIINEVYSNNYSQLYEFEKLLKNPYEKIENKKYITPPLESEKVFETFCGT